jgi:replication factor C subunit 1
MGALWTAKWAPRSLEEVVGNAPALDALRRWLTQWPVDRAKEAKEKEDKEEKDEKEGKKRGKTVIAPRAVLLSGPPGIGKSTAAALVARLLGYDIVELNASDVRNKSSLEATLRMTENTSVKAFFHAQADVPEAPQKVFLSSLCLV